MAMSSIEPYKQLKADRLVDWAATACRTFDIHETTRVTFHRNISPTVFHGEPLLTNGSLWAEAAALAYMAPSPHDVRPHLLLVYFGQVQSSTEPAIAYGRRYLTAWCARVGVGRKWGFALPFAAADALAVLYWGRSTRVGIRVPIIERARSLNIAPRDYSLLRAKALETYRLRLAEAIVQFNRTLTQMEILAPVNRHTQSRITELPALNPKPLERRAA